MKKFVLAGLLGVAAIFATGCGGNACEDFADTYKAKAEECDVEVEVEEPAEGDECTEAEATAAEKASDCIEKLTCADFKDITKQAACFAP